MQDDELQARVRDDIARHGWHVALVPPAAETPGWAHSIGLLERFAHPELLVFGSELPLLHRLVNQLGARIAHGEQFEAGSRRDGVLQGFALAFRPVQPKWRRAFLGNAAWYYRDETLAALQCFWPDPAGCFPWDPESVPAVREQQPLLFLEETHRALSERLIDVLRSEGAL